MSRSPQASIGIFDSGAGGLTVLRAVSRRMPNENLVYFGDTANLPYGSKSQKAVSRASSAVAKFLARQNIKALVVACNTSSALALTDIRKAVTPIPVIGVIDPGARAAAKLVSHGSIGVIATAATVSSNAYARAVKAASPRIKIISVACPLFVPLVEEGLWSGRVAFAVARRYLAKLKRAKVKALILGCTHYPLLRGVIGKVLGPRVSLVDSSEEAACEVESLLQRRSLRRQSRQPGRAQFFVSDDPQRFSALAGRFLGRPIGPVRLHVC